LHRDFVAAIFDVGLKKASPSSILQNMECGTEKGRNKGTSKDVTSDIIKSHLQKYRLHRSRSKKDFMIIYDDVMNKFKSNGYLDNSDGSGLVEDELLSSSEIAAHLSFCVSAVDRNALNTKHDPLLNKTTSSEASNSVASMRAANDAPSAMFKHGLIRIPELKDEEKQTPLGTSFTYLEGLFLTLSQQLADKRSSSGMSNPFCHDDKQILHQQKRIYAGDPNVLSESSSIPRITRTASFYKMQKSHEMCPDQSGIKKEIIPWLVPKKNIKRQNIPSKCIITPKEYTAWHHTQMNPPHACLITPSPEAASFIGQEHGGKKHLDSVQQEVDASISEETNRGEDSCGDLVGLDDQHDDYSCAIVHDTVHSTSRTISGRCKKLLSSLSVPNLRGNATKIFPSVANIIDGIFPVEEMDSAEDTDEQSIFSSSLKNDGDASVTSINSVYPPPRLGTNGRN